MLKSGIGQQKKTFKTDAAATVYSVQKATVTYQTTMSNCLFKSITPFTDYVADSPASVNFFAANLRYLGLEVTPLAHVD